MAQLSQALKKKKKIPQIYRLLSPQNNALLFWGSTRWQSGPPIQICNKRERACEQVWEQKERAGGERTKWSAQMM